MNKYVTKIYKTNFHGDISVLEYLTYKKVLVLFHNTGYKGYYRMDKVLEGNLKDPLNRSVFGVGFFGIGDHKSREKAYSVWNSMIERCYSFTGEASNKNDIYFGKVTVCDEWHNYQNFAKWFYENYQDSYQLDKDLLFKNNTFYSPETCCMLPKDLNSVLINHKGYDTGLPVGITYHKRDKVYAAKCNNGKNVQHLGNYSDIESAKVAYRKFKKERIKNLLNKYPELDRNIKVKLLTYEPYEETIHDNHH